MSCCLALDGVFKLHRLAQRSDMRTAFVQGVFIIMPLLVGRFFFERTGIDIDLYMCAAFMLVYWLIIVTDGDWGGYRWDGDHKRARWLNYTWCRIRELASSGMHLVVGCRK